MGTTVGALRRRLRHLVVRWWRGLHPVMAIRVPLPYPYRRDAGSPPGEDRAAPDPAGADRGAAGPAGAGLR